MVLNGAIGAKLHVPFSVIIRSSFGYYLAYFCIASRAILAMFWLGIQGANGAQCVTVMLLAIAPSYGNIRNTLNANSGITSQGMISYFLFWIIQLPILLVPPTRLRYLFLTKLIVAPTSAICILVWCVHKAGGVGDIFSLEPTVSGSTKAWLWLSCMSAVTGSWATLACNIPDFSRYAKSSRGQYIQLPFLPIIFTVYGVFGIVTTSASKIIYGEYLWNPLDIVAHWLDNGPGGRAAAFFAAFSWYLTTVLVNVTANSISASNDLTVMFPRYVNIKRGCIIAAVIGGWLLVPWKILSSAESFLNFMGGYAVFLAPIAGIMAADYWLVKNQNVDVPALYNPGGRYRYEAGINWRAAAAFLLAVVPNLPGLANDISPTAVFISDGAQNLYSFDWLYGFAISIVLYTGLSKLFPATETLLGSTIYGHENDETSQLDGEENSAEKGLPTSGTVNAPQGITLPII
jgi:nucleobase:cation symporter-1, NCS1 family